MYSQGLFFSVVATLLYLQLARRPTLGEIGGVRFGVYCGGVHAALLSVRRLSTVLVVGCVR